MTVQDHEKLSESEFINNSLRVQPDEWTFVKEVIMNEPEVSLAQHRRGMKAFRGKADKTRRNA
jgi:hypothetical protein